MRKKNYIIEKIESLLFIIGLISILLVVLNLVQVHAATSTTQPSPQFNVCCEKTTSNAWCQNTIQSNCDLSIDPKTKLNFRSTPTSCDATSFCKLGCCINTDEGLCMENTPERVCEQNTGNWVGDATCNVPQCDLGCCLLGDQASYVTLTRCKKLSAFYGLQTNFLKNVKGENNCILMAQLQDKGACVFDYENQRTCKFLTRDECLSSNKTKSNNITSSAQFYKNYLCTADELATNCAPTTNTICLQGKDEVYFVDTCSNPANIYDSTKTYSQQPSYWQKIVLKSASCGFKDSSGNMNSKTCGNCEYFKGSTCKKGSATLGDNICKDLNCYNTKNGKNYKNGESWCVDMGPIGEGRDLVGSRHERHLCINGEETIEQCADFRNEFCIDNKLKTTEGDFSEAACRPNRWKDCLDQTEKDDCLNTDKRDCYWTAGLHYVSPATATATLATTATAGSTTGVLNNGNICLPNIPPGLQFWTDGDAKTICSLGSTKVELTYDKGLLAKKKCSKNCYALDDSWIAKMNNVCISLGDCGAYMNYDNKFTDKGIVVQQAGVKRVNQGLLASVKTKSGTSGALVR